MKKKKTLWLSTIGATVLTSTTVTGVLLKNANNEFDFNSKSKSIEIKKTPKLKKN